MVFDQATIGLMRGGLELWRNSILAIIKLLLLPATAVILHDKFGVGIILSWVVGTALSLALIAIRLRFTGTPVLHRPDWGVLRGLGRTAMAHNWLTLAITMPTSLTPVLVTVIVSPSANAAFYVATMIINFLFIVPSHLATVLFAVAAGEPSVVARKLRFALRLSYLIGLPGGHGLPYPWFPSDPKHIWKGLRCRRSSSYVLANPELPLDCTESPVHWSTVWAGG